MDMHQPLQENDLELDVSVEELDESVHGSFSTASSASSAGTFVGSCFSSAACFSSASS